MTLWVTRDGQTVTIHGNTDLNVRIQGSRVEEFTVSADAQHVKHFWGSLGALIEQADAERAEAIAAQQEAEV